MQISITAPSSGNLSPHQIPPSTTISENRRRHGSTERRPSRETVDPELARRSSAVLLACSGSSEACPAWGEEETEKPPGLRLASSPSASLARVRSAAGEVRAPPAHRIAAANQPPLACNMLFALILTLFLGRRLHAADGPPPLSPGLAAGARQCCCLTCTCALSASLALPRYCTALRAITFNITVTNNLAADRPHDRPRPRQLPYLAPLTSRAQGALRCCSLLVLGACFEHVLEASLTQCPCRSFIRLRRRLGGGHLHGSKGACYAFCSEISLQPHCAVCSIACFAIAVAVAVQCACVYDTNPVHEGGLHNRCSAAPRRLLASLPDLKGGPPTAASASQCPPLPVQQDQRQVRSRPRQSLLNSPALQLI